MRRHVEDAYNPVDGTGVPKTNSLGYALARFLCDLKSIVNILVWIVCIYATTSFMIGYLDNTKKNYQVFSHAVACSIGTLVFYTSGSLIYIGNNACGRAISMKTKNHFHAILMSFGTYLIIVGRNAVAPMLHETVKAGKHNGIENLSYSLVLATLGTGIFVTFVGEMDNVNAFLRIFCKVIHVILGLATHLLLLLLQALVVRHEIYLIFILMAYFALFGFIRLLYLIYLDWKFLRRTL